VPQIEPVGSTYSQMSEDNGNSMVETVPPDTMPNTPAGKDDWLKAEACNPLRVSL
jgi:hypothetical protein